MRDADAPRAVLLDTCAVIWLANREKLRPEAVEVIFHAGEHEGIFIKLAPFTAEIAIDSSSLPQPLHSDPADRLLIATARHLGVPFVTRDRKIEAYGALGHLSVITC